MHVWYTGGGGRGTPYNGQCENALPERSTFFRPQVYERLGIPLVEAGLPEKCMAVREAKIFPFHIFNTVSIQQLKGLGMQASKLGNKRGYYFANGRCTNGVPILSKMVKGKGLVLWAEAPHIKLCRVHPQPPTSNRLPLWGWVNKIHSIRPLNLQRPKNLRSRSKKLVEEMYLDATNW